jgi:hypothetical protein
MVAALTWPAGLKALSRYSPGVLEADVMPDPIGPVEDVTHRWAKRTLTLERRRARP